MSARDQISLGDAESCPACGASWLDKPIPEHVRENYGGKTHFRRVIAIYDPDRDRTVAWKCPDCGKEFSRG